MSYIWKDALSELPTAHSSSIVALSLFIFLSSKVFDVFTSEKLGSCDSILGCLYGQNDLEIIDKYRDCDSIFCNI